MIVTITLDPDVAARLERQATRAGQDIPAFVQGLAAREADTMNTNVYDPMALLATLHAFSDTDEYGDEAEQRETLETLKAALNSDRPGQRLVFGGDVNSTQGDGA